MKRAALTGFFFVLLTSCTFAPKDIGRSYMFALVPAQTLPHQPVKESLIVSMPSSAPELDTYRIALIRDGNRWDYYAGARWADFLPLMVQDSMAKTLETAKLFKTVATDETGGNADRILKIQIRSFQAEYDPAHSAPAVKLKIAVSLRNRVEGTILYSFDLKTETRATQNKLPEIQAAFARAFSDVQKQLVNQLTWNLSRP